MITRRQLLSAGVKAGAAALVSNGCAGLPAGPTGVSVNDVHSQLNAVRVARVARPTGVEDVQREIEAARREGRAVSIAGGRHAMGGQQFAQEGDLLDMTGINRVLRFDTEAGCSRSRAASSGPS